MKYLLSILFILYTLYFILTPPPILAGHPQMTTGFYCDGNEIWQDVYYREDDNLSEDKKHTFVDRCGANQVCIPYPVPAPIYSQNAICQDIAELGQSGNGTKMHVPATEIKRGSPVEIGIGLDKAGFDKIQVSSLRIGGRLESCRFNPEPTTQNNCGCDTKPVTVQYACTDPRTGRSSTCSRTDQVACGPEDWNQVNPYKDDKQCWKTISCQTNPTGAFDLPLVTDDTNYNNHALITVVQSGAPTLETSANCRKGAHNISSGQPDTNNILITSLSDDQENVDAYCVGTISKELCDQAKQDAELEQKNPLKIQSGIQIEAFQKGLNCSALLSFISNFGRFFGIDLCRKPTIIGNGQTSEFDKKAALLANSVRPPGDFAPATQDCAWIDAADTEGGQLSEGNKKVLNISRNLGTDDGFLTINTPEYPLTLDPTKDNAVTETVVLDGSDIAPDINERCKKSCTSSYPESVCLPDSSILCINRVTTGTNQTPVNLPNSCQQACFSTLDRCENDGCANKTGSDHDNCVNECVITKDKCIKACGG